MSLAWFAETSKRLHVLPFYRSWAYWAEQQCRIKTLEALVHSKNEAPKIQLEGLGERCELPQWGLERSPSRNRIWCIIA